MSKFKHKSASKVLDWGQSSTPQKNVQIQADKSASNNLDSGWTPPPFGQCPNRSRVSSGIASLSHSLDFFLQILVQLILSLLKIHSFEQTSFCFSFVGMRVD